MRWVCGLLFVSCPMQATGSVSAREMPAATSTKTRLDQAAMLAKLIYPEALNRAITKYTIIHVVTPAYHADPGLQSLEAVYPGIIDAMITAMRPEFEEGRVDALPALWAKTADAYASNLSLDELLDAVAFYSGPAGQQLSIATRDAIANAPPASAQGHEGIDRSYTSKPDDVRLNRSFNSTATGRKLAALKPQIDAIIAAWSKAPTPEADARVNAALSKVVARYSRSAPRPVHESPAEPPEQPLAKPTE